MKEQDGRSWSVYTKWDVYIELDVDTIDISVADSQGLPRIQYARISEWRLSNRAFRYIHITHGERLTRHAAWKMLCAAHSCPPYRVWQRSGALGVVHVLVWVGSSRSACIKNPNAVSSDRIIGPPFMERCTPSRCLSCHLQHCGCQWDPP